jgi:hypothetical protein
MFPIIEPYHVMCAHIKKNIQYKTLPLLSNEKQ